jgi:hypothetical protein
LENGGTPSDLRERVRSEIRASLRHDFDLRSARTARLLLLAGVAGIAGSLGAMLMISGHPFDHHAQWHVAVFSALWAGLLVVAWAVVLLQVRTPSLPLARAATIGLLGLGLAGVCGAVCPDPHFLTWWSNTGFGAALVEGGWPWLSAFCFGLLTSVFIGAGAAAVAWGPPRSARISALLPAFVLLVLLSPGVALQAVGYSWMMFLGWWVGTGIGAFLGVASGLRLRVRLGIS